MKRKKVLSVALTAAILSASAAGCGGNAGSSAVGTDQTSAAGSSQQGQSDEKIQLTLCSPDNTFGLSTDSELQQAVIDMLEEKADVEINAIIPPISSYNEKLETMISGGDVPDVFYVSQAMTRLPNYIARGRVLPLNDYISNSEALSIIDQDMFDVLAVDGQIYHVPYVMPKMKVLFLRKDIMDEYGINLSNTPTTEEFKTEMMKLNGTGIIPLSLPKFIDNLQFFMNSFGAYAGIYQNGNGEYVDGFQEPQMIDALEYLRDLYESGVIDQEFITTENATMREYVYTGKAASDLEYTTNYSTYQKESANAGNESEIFPIYCLYGPEGEGSCLNESVQIAYCISADCENPDKAFQLIETLIADPEMYPAFFNIGVERAHYIVNDQGYLEPTEKAANSGYAPKYSYLYDSFIPEFNMSFKLDPEIENSLPEQKEIIDKANAVKGPKYMLPSGKSTMYDECAASITSTWQEIVSQVILGSVTVEEGMENYRNFWNSIDGDAMLEELNAG